MTIYLLYITLEKFSPYQLHHAMETPVPGLTQVEGGTESHTCTHGINQACQKGD